MKVNRGKTEINIAKAIIAVIDAYVIAKRKAFESFIVDCKIMAALETRDHGKVKEFIKDRLKLNVDARVFEIVSFAILKAHYSSQSIFWGWSEDEIEEEQLILYKTGRTNANDGGIDFVMKPLGRFFQVTETLDVKKYFLDIEKIQRYPLTFIIKSQEPIKDLKIKLRKGAIEAYSVKRIVDRYMNCIEEIINVPKLLDCFDEVLKNQKLKEVIDEIVVQSKVEFNYGDST